MLPFGLWKSLINMKQELSSGSMWSTLWVYGQKLRKVLTGGKEDIFARSIDSHAFEWENIQSPPLEDFKSQLDKAQSNLTWPLSHAFGVGLGERPPLGSFLASVILWFWFTCWSHSFSAFFLPNCVSCSFGVLNKFLW